MTLEGRVRELERKMSALEEVIKMFESQHEVMEPPKDYAPSEEGRGTWEGLSRYLIATFRGDK
jgi:hypothetical protein